MPTPSLPFPLRETVHPNHGYSIRVTSCRRVARSQATRAAPDPAPPPPAPPPSPALRSPEHAAGGPCGCNDGGDRANPIPTFSVPLVLSDRLPSRAATCKATAAARNGLRATLNSEGAACGRALGGAAVFGSACSGDGASSGAVVAICVWAAAARDDPDLHRGRANLVGRRSDPAGWAPAKVAAWRGRRRQGGSEGCQELRRRLVRWRSTAASTA